MGGSKQRPRPLTESPAVTAKSDPDRALLEKLMRICMNRLNVARRMEKERSIVFPETSVILRDVLRLRDLLNEGGKAGTGKGENDDAAESVPVCDALEKALNRRPP